MLVDEVSSHAVVPIKRQEGFLKLTHQLLDALQDKLEPHLSTLLPVVMTLGYSCVQLLSSQRDKVSLDQT